MSIESHIRFIERRWFWAIALWLDGRLYSGPGWKNTGTKCPWSEAWEIAWYIAHSQHRIDWLRRPKCLRRPTDGEHKKRA
jgi:hypothetical protein